MPVVHLQDSKHSIRFKIPLWWPFSKLEIQLANKLDYIALVVINLEAGEASFKAIPLSIRCSSSVKLDAQCAPSPTTQYLPRANGRMPWYSCLRRLQPYRYPWHRRSGWPIIMTELILMRSCKCMRPYRGPGIWQVTGSGDLEWANIIWIPRSRWRYLYLGHDVPS